MSPFLLRVLIVGLFVAQVATIGVEAARPFEIVIQRNMSCIDGATVGSLSVNGKEVTRTLELPFKDNANSVSRVLPGTYEAMIRTDGTKGWRIELRDVPKRTRVQLHVGNYTRDTEGCVLLGLDVSSATTDKGTTCAVTKSKDAFAALQMAMQNASDDGLSSQALAIKVTLRD